MRRYSSAEWSVVYEQWKADNMEMTKDQRKQIVRGCYGKNVYHSMEEAVQSFVHKRPNPGRTLSAYQCRICDCYHTGNKKREKWMGMYEFPVIDGGKG